MTFRAQLETARLRLRPVEPRDEAAVLAGLNDLAVSGWLSRVPYPYASADFAQFRAEFARPGETFTVEDDAGFAGVVGCGGELGYWFASRCHGRGYAAEAVRAVLAMQFVHGRRAVTSGYFEGNARSARVLEKLGFVETGRGMKFCKPLGLDRRHVDLRLTPGAFRSLPPAPGKAEGGSPAPAARQAP